MSIGAIVNSFLMVLSTNTKRKPESYYSDLQIFEKEYVYDKGFYKTVDQIEHAIVQKIKDKEFYFKKSLSIFVEKKNSDNPSWEFSLTAVDFSNEDMIFLNKVLDSLNLNQIDNQGIISAYYLMQKNETKEDIRVPVKNVEKIKIFPIKATPNGSME